MRYGLIFLLLTVALASCNINRNLMFRTDHDYEFDIPKDSTQLIEYRLAPNDIITMQVFSNKGAEILNMTAGTGSGGTSSGVGGAGGGGGGGGVGIGVGIMQGRSINYFVEIDGTVELPELGYVKLEGMTIREAEAYLEKLYAQLYREPFVMLRAVNNRVFVFPGSGGEAMVVTLTNNNVTLIEALALAGGIQQRGDARKVKLIRQLEDRKEVYQMNLATIEGIDAATMVVQANDIIYVDPVPRVPAEILRDVAPVFALISNIALIAAIFGGVF